MGICLKHRATNSEDIVYSPNKYRETEGIKDSFSINHTTPYAVISLQEANLYRFYPKAFWYASCLSVNAGADENNDDNKSTNYGQIGIATSQMKGEGITILNPLINEARLRFEPDIERDAVIYGMKGINGIGDEVAQTIIKNQPYTSIEDFAARMLDTKLVQNAQMVMLIKAGCFLNLHSQDRFETMEWYLERYKYKETEKLTLQQLNTADSYGIIPEDLHIYVRYIRFRKYVLDDEGLYETYVDPNKKVPKCGYHDRYFILDDESQAFFTEQFSEDSVIKIVGEHYVISEKAFKKEVENLIQPLKDWLVLDEANKAYTDAQHKVVWDQFAAGNEAHWSMQSLTYYDQDHELAYINEAMYGVVNFFNLPEQPEVYETYTRKINGEVKTFNKNKIVRIAGTVLKSDNTRHTISLLTCYGVVTVKYSKGQHAFYAKQISRSIGNGKKETIEKSWFQRGTLLLVAGCRIEDNFRAMVYSDSIYKHTTEKITEVHSDGTLLLQAERVKV